MNLEKEYNQWLESNTDLKSSSIDKYIGGIKTMQNDLENKGIKVPNFYEVANVSEILNI